MDIKDAASFEAVPGHGIRVVIDGKDVLVGNRRLMQDQRSRHGAS